MIVVDNNSKCPLCGGKIVFDPASQKNLCKTCNSYFIINEYNNFDDFQKDKTKSKCPNCGAQLIFHENTYSAECKYCNSKFSILTLNPGKATPEKIIPFTVPLEEFKKSVIKYLTEGEYTPADIFDQVEFISTKGVYIPLYYFDTSYAVKYVAEIGYNRTETYLDYGFGSECNKLVKKTRFVTDWSPYSDTLEGSCSTYAIGTSMFDKFNVITEKNKKYTNKVDEIISFCEESVDNLKPYNENYLAGFEVIPYELSPDEAYEQTAKPKIKQLIENRVTSIVPGDQYRNMQWNGKEKKEKIIPFLKPFWITKFSYKNEGYIFIMDGTDKDKVTGTKPFDKDSRKAVSKHYLPVKLSLCLIPLVIGFLIAFPKNFVIILSLFFVIFSFSMAYATSKKNKITKQGLSEKLASANKYLENPDLLFSKKSKHKEEDLSYGSVDDNWKDENVD